MSRICGRRGQGRSRDRRELPGKKLSADPMGGVALSGSMVERLRYGSSRHCPQPHATFGTSRLTLIDAARARICARSKFACMRSHVSAVLPTACSSR